jgi:iduronate 2-sulfatase
MLVKELLKFGTRVTFCKLVGFALLFIMIDAAVADDLTHDADARPNVLFIAVDDMRVELGCYGQTIVKSPNIDRLAQQGTLFMRAYCQQAVCNPSRASLLTGLRPETLGIWDLPTHFRQRRPDIVTLPQHFKQNGYHTQGIGKIFHNWRQDDFKGDTVSWSVPSVMQYATHSSDTAVVDGRVPPDQSGVPRTEMRDVPDEAYFDGRIASKAVATLQELSQHKQPFFLAVGFWKPHSPFNAPKRYWDLYARSDIKPPSNPAAPQNVPHIALHDSREILRGFRTRPNSRPTSGEVLALRHGYYAAISYVDAQVGRLLDELDRLKLRDNTLIVFWSDHGFHLGEHSLWAKTSNFELDARVPLIIATPQVEHRLSKNAGQQTEALVELLDLYPTLVDLCNLPQPDHLEGKSLRPVLDDDPMTQVKSGAFTWHPRPAYPAAGVEPNVMGHSMRTDRFRYTEWRKFGTNEIVARELYDHDNDPHETINVANNAQFAEPLSKLHAQMRSAR